VTKDALPTSVLDVGCGYGVQSVLFHGLYPGAAYTGINIGAAQVDAANERVAGLSGYQVKQASATDLSLFTDSTFSHVYALECAFHFEPSRLPFFAEAHRVLQPGGKLAMMDVINFSPRLPYHREKMGCMTGTLTYYLQKASRRSGRSGMPVTEPEADTIETYKASLESAGYTDVQVVDISDKIFWWESFASVPEPLVHPLGRGLYWRIKIPGAANFLNWRDLRAMGCTYVHVTATKPK